jgi:hypothetical protein
MAPVAVNKQQSGKPIHVPNKAPPSKFYYIEK